MLSLGVLALHCTALHCTALLCTGVPCAGGLDPPLWDVPCVIGPAGSQPCSLHCTALHCTAHLMRCDALQCAMTEVRVGYTVDTLL
jgi:hypothetical protein